MKKNTPVTFSDEILLSIQRNSFSFFFDVEKFMSRWFETDMSTRSMTRKLLDRLKTTETKTLKQKLLDFANEHHERENCHDIGDVEYINTKEDGYDFFQDELIFLMYCEGEETRFIIVKDEKPVIFKLTGEIDAFWTAMTNLSISAEKNDVWTTTDSGKTWEHHVKKNLYPDDSIFDFVTLDTKNNVLKNKKGNLFKFVHIHR